MQQPDFIIVKPDTAAENDTLSILEQPGQVPYEIKEQLLDFDGEFLHGNPYIHPELPYRSHGANGQLLPYAPYRDDLVVGSLLLCMLLLTFVFNKMRKMLHQQAKDFFYKPKEHKSSNSVESVIRKYSRLSFVMLLCFLGGLVMFSYAQQHLHFFPTDVSSSTLLSIFVGSFVIYFLVKHLLSAFVNWIFFPKSKQKLWREGETYLISVETLFLFPLILVVVFLSPKVENIAIVFLTILLTIKFLLAFKTYQIFFNKSYCLLHLFMYLCALELMPLLALWRALVIMTESI